MTDLKKPMLAAKFDPDKAVYPLMGSIKVDGIRCLIKDGVAVSRSLKPIPNKYVQKWAARNARRLEGADGELVVGNLEAEDCFRKTSSAIMSFEGNPDFSYWVFDLWNRPVAPFYARYDVFTFDLWDVDRVCLLNQETLNTLEEVLDFLDKQTNRGYEGIMLRDPYGLYKMGRATVNQRQLMKLKKFEDAEAIVIGLEEEMHNANEAHTNEVGATERSHHKENMIGKNTLGALRVQLIDGSKTEFKVGTGFSAQERLAIWRSKPIGAIIKFKYFPTGSKDKPRFPVFLGFRDRIDI
jgi:DNA ligase-1